MRALRTPLDGVLRIVDMPWFSDHRGAFGRMFCVESFRKMNVPFTVRQVNLSRTQTRGALRGMHFQRGAAAEDKLIQCLRGRIFDVAVDLRAGSATYGQWYGIELSEERAEALVVPKGCAHGFQAMSDDVEMLYMMSADYAPQAEGGLHHSCPEVAIDWPLSVADLSKRDMAFPNLAELEPIRL